MDTRGEYVDISTLHQWENNPKDDSQEGLERLDYQLELGQYKPLIAMNDGTVLGGNQRHKRMIVKGTNPVWISRVDFKQDNDTFYAVVNGVEIKDKRYKSIEDGMMAYALSDNEQAAPYNFDKLKLQLSAVDIDLSKYSAISLPAVNCEEIIKEVTQSGTSTTPEEKKTIKCPECGHEFSP